MPDIVIENAAFRLAVGGDGLVHSLIVRDTGEECLDPGQEIALFTVTQPRPYNNEVKLAHPNKRTTWPCDPLRREGDELVAGFRTVPMVARIGLRIESDYVAFRLTGFDVAPEAYPGLTMTMPPVSELRLCQLPVRRRERFGEWLNVVWDDSAAVCVMAASPRERIDQESRPGCRVLFADARKETGLIGAEAVLIASQPERFLDAVDHMERDFGLPRGVQSRKGGLINASVYWTGDICPENVDRHIARCLQGGFRLMLIYYTAMFREADGYSYCGDYDYNERYPRGREDVAAVLERVKQAGITPGLHFLQTHIGLKSRYVTPHADARLGKKRLFTLMRAYEEGDDALYVAQDPAGSEMYPGCRILQFGGELLSYEGFESEPARRFTGVRRGACGTRPEDHPAGQIGGILDVSEFGATSCYIDQNTDLQDEIAGKIADCYDAGFRFCYMDGSEGASEPYECHVPGAQYRVIRRFAQPPLFTEGAAKAHFSWHFQAGANAFDIFPPAVFKAMIDKYPGAEAPAMRQDFTRLDFGWWGFWAPGEKDNGIQADMYEYGTSRAAGWDCPAAVQSSLERFERHPRTGDILKVMRRWEDVRATGWLSEEQKAALRQPGREHTLLVDEEGNYELAEWTRLTAPADISAYYIARKGMSCVVYWHERGEGELGLSMPPEDFTAADHLGGEPFRPESVNGYAFVPAGNKRYIMTPLSRERIQEIFAGAVLRNSKEQS